MRGPLDSVKALLDHPDMSFFFNNAEAYKGSLKQHTGKQTQRLYTDFESDSSDRPVNMGEGHSDSTDHATFTQDSCSTFASFSTEMLHNVLQRDGIEAESYRKYGVRLHDLVTRRRSHQR